MNKNTNPRYRSGKKWNSRDRFVHITQSVVQRENTDPATGVITTSTHLTHPVQYVKGR